MDENTHQEILSEFELEAINCIKQEIEIIATDEEDVYSEDESIEYFQKPENDTIDVQLHPLPENVQNFSISQRPENKENLQNFSIRKGPAIEENVHMFSICLFRDEVWKATDLVSACQILQELVPTRAKNCGDCQKCFSNRDFLMKHLTKDHLPWTARKHLCPWFNCDEVYSKSGELKYHISSVHNLSNANIDKTSWDFVNDSDKKLILDDGIELIPDPENPHEFTTKQELKIRSYTNKELYRKFRIHERSRIAFADTESADGFSEKSQATLALSGMENQVISVIKPKSTETSTEKNKQISLLKIPQSSETHVVEDFDYDNVIYEKVKVSEHPAWKYGSGWKKEPGEMVEPAGWEFQKLSRTSVWLADESTQALESLIKTEDTPNHSKKVFIVAEDTPNPSKKVFIAPEDTPNPSEKVFISRRYSQPFQKSLHHSSRRYSQPFQKSEGRSQNNQGVHQ